MTTERVIGLRRSLGRNEGSLQLSPTVRLQSEFPRCLFPNLTPSNQAEKILYWRCWRRSGRNSRFSNSFETQYRDFGLGSLKRAKERQSRLISTLRARQSLLQQSIQRRELRRKAETDIKAVLGVDVPRGVSEYEMRKRALEVAKKRQEEESARRIQQAWKASRVERVRNRLQVMLTQSAITIQKHWRRYQAQRQFSSQQQRRRHHAAVQIQRHWRGYQ